MLPADAGDADAPFDRASPPELSREASAFFGGVLAHLPGLLPFTAPSAGAEWGSYARLRPGCWAGASACWGWDDREAPLRATRPGGPDSTNVEYKAHDGTANPYVALAALAAAGGLGLESGTALPPLTQPAAASGDGEGSAEEGAGGAGQAAALPASLREALDALDADAALLAAVEGALGAPLLRAFLAVREGELAAAPSLADVVLRY
jgi:glutamine synthetase